MFGELPLLNGTIKRDDTVQLGYFAQSQIDQLDMRLNALENVLHSNPEISESEARHILGSMLFQGEEALKQVSVMFWW